MTDSTFDRFFGVQHAFDHPVTLWATLSIALIAAGAGIAIQVLWRLKKVPREMYDDLYRRWKSWLWLGLFVLTPILLGAAWTIAAVALLSLGCYREFARATGLFREKAVNAAVVLGILTVTFAVVDHYDRLFFATVPLTVALIAIVSIPFDRPHGYVQRVGLATFGFLLFGFSLGYVGNVANDPDYRPTLLLLLLGVELNDILAYCCGKLFGRKRLLPNTSPGKTVGGAVGAFLLTTPLVALLGHFVFLETAVDRWHVLLGLGVIVGILGQLGDLVLSSIKRDVGVKDMGVTIPGHGGLLDRFDSLILVAPAVYHYLSLHLGPLASDQPVRIMTGG